MARTYQKYELLSKNVLDDHGLWIEDPMRYFLQTDSATKFALL